MLRSYNGDVLSLSITLSHFKTFTDFFFDLLFLQSDFLNFLPSYFLKNHPHNKFYKLREQE